MNKQSLIGFILIAAILFGWMWWMQPSKEELAEQKRIQDSIMMARREAAVLDSIRLAEQQRVEETQSQLLNPSTPPSAMDSASLAQEQYRLRRDKYSVFASASQGDERYWTLENQLQRITLASKGGYIREVELLDYKTYDSLPLISFDPETAVSDLSFFLNNRIINTSELYFEPFLNGQPFQGNEVLTREGDSVQFSLRAYTDNLNGQRNENQYLEFVYTLRDDNYMLGFDFRTVGMREVLSNNASNMNLDWKVDLTQHEKDVDRFTTTTVYYMTMNDQDVDRLDDRRKKEETINASINWVSFKERFFCNALVAKNGFSSAKIATSNENSKNPKNYPNLYYIFSK